MSQIPQTPVEERKEEKVIQQPGVERREQIVQDVGSEHRQTLFKVTNVIWLIGGLIEGLIGLRVLLRLIAANSANAFAQLVYQLSQVFVGPFLTLTGSPSTSSGVILEIPSLIAMLVYFLIIWFIARLIWAVLEKPRARSSSTYEVNKG
jgi:uncharacterized membrane protein